MTRELHCLQYGTQEIQYEIVRRPRKTLEIAVEPDASVVIAAPEDATLVRGAASGVLANDADGGLDSDALAVTELANGSTTASPGEAIAGDDVSEDDELDELLEALAAE